MNSSNKYESTNFITGIRAIAILLVFLTHAGSAHLISAPPLLSEFIRDGQFGVNIFFCLSGFTIFYQICHEQYEFKSFLIVRFLRLSIPYYPLIFLFSAYMMYSGDVFNEWATLNAGHISLANVFYHMTYLSFVHLHYANTIIGVEWSLAIEAFYYLLFGVILTTNRYKYLPVAYKSVLWIAFFLFSFNVQWIVMAVMKPSVPIDDLLFHFTPFKHGYAFLLGGLAYHFRTRVQQIKNRRFLHYASDIVVVLAPFMVLSNLVLQIISNVDVLYAVLTAVLIVFVQDTSNFGRIFNNLPMQFIGKISYSFYLWHFFVLHAALFKFQGIQSLFLLFSLKCFIALFLSFCWYVIFEKTFYVKAKSYALSKKIFIAFHNRRNYIP